MKCTTCFDKIIQLMDDKTLPFTEKIISDSLMIRTFDPKYPDHLFKWHWDDADRLITPIGDTTWEFQFDNKLPEKITQNGIFIPKGVYHRIIKGNDILKLLIETIQ